MMLARRKERFAEPFYARHRSHITGVPGCGLALLAVSGTVAAINWGFALDGQGGMVYALAASALFLMFVWSAVAGYRDQFRVRVLPYFERPVGGTDTWLAGESLVWHSRALDEIAVQCGVTPLSAFASGDDLVVGEVLQWFEPADALRTVERLLEADVAVSLPVGVVSDLERLRDALRLASAAGVRFCLLVREGSFANGHEMSVRKGTFF